ncbi:hypothetical protein BSKO_06174 [Bryopsis sp. KO-2023]|nr:hypothetical protein BSKO_06174 [Bryopsis sp. KO-2023]
MAVESEHKESVGRLHKGVPGDRVHFCSSCVFPIAVYGRLSPCLHTFCLTCAADMEKCFICHANINRIERVQGDVPLFVSAITLQSFKSEDDLRQHTKRVHSSLLSKQEGPIFEPHIHKALPNPGAGHHPLGRPP